MQEGYRSASRQRTRRLSDGELKSLFEACDTVKTSLPLADIVRFALCTAMRRSEILRLRWDDVDFDRRVVKVRSRKHPRDPQRVDEVPLMRAHATWPAWDALALIEKQPRRGALVFPYGARALSDRFDAACTKAKLADVVLHLLRHESLSRYAERGMDVLRLQLIGGHRSLQHLQRYAKLDAARLASE